MFYHEVIMKRDEEMESQLMIRREIDKLEDRLIMVPGYALKIDSLQNKLAYSCRLMVALDILMCNLTPNK